MNKLLTLPLLLATSAFASPITMTVNVSGTNHFDYVTESYVPGDYAKQVSFTFENSGGLVSDYGQVTVVDFIDSTPGTKFNTTYPGAYYYTLTDTNDYPGDFVTDVAAQGNSYHPNADGTITTYHIELRFRSDSSGNPGDGTADYALQGQELTNYLQNFNTFVYYSEFEYTYRVNDDHTVTYYSGEGYQDGRALVAISAVPEPATYALFLIGLAGVGALRRHTSSK